MNHAAYSLLLLRPHPERVDVLCVGAVVRDVAGTWHVAMPPVTSKLRPFGHYDADRIELMSRNLRALLEDCLSLAEARQRLTRSRSTLTLHDFEGAFAYGNAKEFHDQLRAIMQESVLPEREPPVIAQQPVRRVRPHIRARLRRQFEQLGIMGNDINDHKVVRSFPVSSRHGLTAEFALKNSVMHITETVDFEVGEDSVRGKTYEAQAKCLVLRAAQDTFGPGTRCHVVVNGGAAQHAARSVDLLSTVGTLYAAENAQDMDNYVQAMVTAARGGNHQLSVQ